MGSGRDIATLTERGLSDAGPTAVAGHLRRAWDGFLTTATGADLQAPTRLPGWRVRDVLVHLGSWPEAPTMGWVLDAARSGRRGPPYDSHERNERLVRAHAGAGRDEVLQALHEARRRTLDWLDSAEAGTLGRAIVTSPVGPLPVLGVLLGGTYELAVHALDLAATGAPAVDPGLLLTGLGALTDITGALAAQADLEIAVAAVTPHGSWRFATGPAGWTTQALPPGTVVGVAVLASAADLLEVSAGRAHVPALVAQRRLHVQHLAAFLRLAPVVEAAPGIPGGPALRAATRTLGRVGSLISRLPHLPGMPGPRG